MGVLCAFYDLHRGWRGGIRKHWTGRTLIIVAWPGQGLCLFLVWGAGGRKRYDYGCIH